MEKWSKRKINTIVVLPEWRDDDTTSSILFLPILHYFEWIDDLEQLTATLYSKSTITPVQYEMNVLHHLSQNPIWNLYRSHPLLEQSESSNYLHQDLPMKSWIFHEFSKTQIAGCIWEHMENRNWNDFVGSVYFEQVLVWHKNCIPTFISAWTENCRIKKIVLSFLMFMCFHLQINQEELCSLRNIYFFIPEFMYSF